ncbi:hypothetical protein B0H66DRAFT_45321 [Apodospora peruviana]|uniref:Uncharacterized protein n=1 Tax=Apodospora peruviana TaxID=516989 RepID=A0AAE0MF21_9PEZI|nr:hypothetical protein B0H66DRAFT_45321 [Apodospora peruviana]
MVSNVASCLPERTRFSRYCDPLSLFPVYLSHSYLPLWKLFPPFRLQYLSATINTILLCPARSRAGGDRISLLSLIYTVVTILHNIGFSQSSYIDNPLQYECLYVLKPPYLFGRVCERKAPIILIQLTPSQEYISHGLTYLPRQPATLWSSLLPTVSGRVTRLLSYTNLT